MRVTLEAGNFGWDYLLRFSNGQEYLVQSDREYPEAAHLFGFVGEQDDYRTVGQYRALAGQFLDESIGGSAEIDERHPFLAQAQPRLVETPRRPALTAPLKLTFTASGLLVTHDGSLDLDEINELLNDRNQEAVTTPLPLKRRGF